MRSVWGHAGGGWCDSQLCRRSSASSGGIESDVACLQSWWLLYWVRRRKSPASMTFDLCGPVLIDISARPILYRDLYGVKDSLSRLAQTRSTWKAIQRRCVVLEQVVGRVGKMCSVVSESS